MVRSILTNLALFLCALTALAQTKTVFVPAIVPSPKTTAVLEKRVPELMGKADIPGISMAVVRDGKPYWIHAFGLKNADAHDSAVSDDTIFEAASLSKPVFAYAVMKLVDEGKVDLDAPLSKYLDKPYLPDNRIEQITARYVLSHRTGFPNWRPRGGELQIRVAPGERFSYSGEGFVYLANVVEHITGMPFEAFMKKTVFDPLGMTSSSYVWRDDYDARTATGHDALEKPQKKGKPTEPNAAATLHTTAGDYAKFMGAVLNGMGLRPQTWHEMLRSQIAVDPACTNCTDRTPSPQMSRTISWGLGWGIEHTSDGDTVWHWGDNGDFRCFVVAYPRQKTGVVMFTNSENGLLIAEDVVKLAIGGDHPAFAWIDYGTYNSPDFQFAKTLQNTNADAVIAKYRSANLQGPSLSERAINSAGYRLLAQDRVVEAIRVLQWNVELYPKSSNVYDSLGEAYMTHGDKELAIKNYEKSLELDPRNSNAIEMLKKLRQ